MRKLFTNLTRPWKRSLALQLETLLLLSALWPLLVFGLLLGFTANYLLAFLGTAGAGVIVALVGHRRIARLSAPLATLNRQLQATAGGDLRMRLPTETALRQSDAVTAFTAARFDAILLAPMDAQELLAPVRAARAAGIPVVTVDATLADPAVALAQVLTDNYGGGQQAAAALIRLLNGHGRVAIIGLTHHQPHSRAREAGFTQGLAATPGIQVVVVQHALADRRLAEEIADNLLQQYPDLAAFYATNEDAAVGLIAALRKQGPHAPKRRAICWDMAALEREALAAGLIDALIVQDVGGLGYHGVQVAVAALAGHPVPTSLKLPTRLITRDNTAQLAQLAGAADAARARRPAIAQLGRPARIAFAIRSPRSQFWVDLVAGAQAAAQAAGVELVIHDSQEGDVNEIDQLREAFNLMSDNIRVLVRQLQQEALIIGPRAQALVVAAAGQAHGAEEQTASLERLYEGIARLDQAAREIAVSSEDVATSAAGTLRGMTQAQQAVGNSSLRLREIIQHLSNTLEALSQRTAQVGEVAESMRDIADQTHLLALNASIESAGAGVYGRRFAVIAGEVQGLATQALDATTSFQEIATTMGVAAEQGLAATQASARGTDLSMELVTQATSAIESIAGLAEHTSSAVQRITVATAEQQQTNGNLADFAAQVTTSARQAAQESAALSTVAQELTQVVTRLQETVAFFRIADDEAGRPALSLPGEGGLAPAPTGRVVPAAVLPLHINGRE